MQIYSTPKQSCEYSLSHVDYKLQANVCILAMSITIKGCVWYLLNIFVFFFIWRQGNEGFGQILLIQEYISWAENTSMTALNFDPLIQLAYLENKNIKLLVMDRQTKYNDDVLFGL